MWSGQTKLGAQVRFGFRRFRLDHIAILTLAPLALGISRGAGLQRPLATAIIFGLTAAVPLVLLFLPASILATGKKHPQSQA